VTASLSLDIIQAELQQSKACLERALDSDFPQQIALAASVIVDSLTQGHKLLIFGNGGSSSDAQHWAGELVVRFQKNRRALPAIALSADSTILTACGNDFGFTEVFARQIEALGQQGDVAIGISTSGNSANVLQAFQAAHSLGLTNILLTGATDGLAVDYCDIRVTAPATTTARIQELHLLAYHTICTLVDSRFSN
jgi:D-sedoheptulose 7-phosphate isomerase